MKDPHDELDSDIISDHVMFSGSTPLIRPPGGETDSWPPDRPVTLEELFALIPYSKEEILWMIEHEAFDPCFVDPTTMEMTWYGVSTWLEINRNDLPEWDDPSKPF